MLEGDGVVSLGKIIEYAAWLIGGLMGYLVVKTLGWMGVLIVIGIMFIIYLIGFFLSENKIGTANKNTLILLLAMRIISLVWVFYSLNMNFIAYDLIGKVCLVLTITFTIVALPLLLVGNRFGNILIISIPIIGLYSFVYYSIDPVTITAAFLSDYILGVLSYLDWNGVKTLFN